MSLKYYDSIVKKEAEKGHERFVNMSTEDLEECYPKEYEED